jgi:cyclic-di-GMP-binding protein
MGNGGSRLLRSGGQDARAPASAPNLENTFTCPRFDVILNTYQSYMAQQNSFDIVSQVDRAEITNAIHQTVKEVRQRFDFKGSNANVALEENSLVLSAEDETKLRNMNDIFQQKLVRRGVPLKALSYGTTEPAAGGTVRQRVQVQQGIPQEKAKDIVKFIKDSKAKVQASIQGDTVRVSGKDRDTLQQVIAGLKAKDFGINMQFTNYRTN